jgi:3-dehydroquinate dehydratase/shikimate dehydrogenase
MNNGKICVSICAETADEIIQQIKRAEGFADVIEIRFDCLKENEINSALQMISKLNGKNNLLATSRPQNKLAEFFFGKIIGKTILEKRLKAFQDRINLWNRIFTLTNIKYLDFEDDLFLGLIISHIFDNEIFQRHQIIFSYHNFSDASDDLNRIFNDFNSADEFGIKSDIIKIAVQSQDVTDTIPIWQLLKRAKSENKQIIPIAMGESGKWTRILGLAHGTFMTYGSLDSGKETAPGQVTAKDLIEVYRAKELDEKTEVFSILGSNTAVSMSPYLHNTAFKFHHLNSVFVPLQVHDLDEFMRRMVKPKTREIELNFRGFSVTIPHKQSIIKHLDCLDETAKKIGAVNTVQIVDGNLYGYNTDAEGFIEPLKTAYGDLKNAKVAVLGAGGAARACIYALQNEGAEVTIFARDLTKAATLANDFQVELQKFPKTKNHKLKPDFNIIVNTTPLGMNGKFPDQTPLTAGQIKGVQLVYDLVYNPLETPFLREAKSVNVRTIGGLEMLIAQAVKQSELWTGKPAPIEEMKQAALNRLL